MTEVELRATYEARKQFKPLHKRTQRWGIAVCHRRAGKTVACVNELVRRAGACKLKNPRFAYIAPQLNQAKDIAWTYLKEYTAFIPGVKPNESELWVELPGGARIRIYGADNPDRLRGIYLDGAVLDEFGDMDPTVWAQVIRPALSDRKGWAIFIGTPKGKNTFNTLWINAEDDLDWFRLMLKASETGLLDAAELADARKMMSADEYDQEYECSFEAAVKGAYYGKEMNDAEGADRICGVPYDPRLPVHTAWDLGVADSTVIWFIQTVGRETRIIDCLKGEGVGLDWYAKRLFERDYVWGSHYLPHDVEVRELGTGKSRKEVLQGLGIKATVCPNIPIADGIQAVRMLLPTCWFDKVKCKAGIEALRMYRREYDDKRQEFKQHPLHDWCFTGDTKVLTRHGMCRIDSLSETGEVLTPCGWRKYHSPRVTRRDAPLVEVSFADGLTVRCTPDHMFMTASGWKSADRLETGSQIQSSLTLSRSISMAVSTACGLAKFTTREAARSCIETFGRMRSAIFPRAATSTIGIATPQTTRSPISNVWMRRSIGWLSAARPLRQRAANTLANSLATGLPNGTALRPADCGTGVTPSGPRVGRNGSANRGHASSVAKSLIVSFARTVTSRSSAIRTAKPRTIASVRRLTETSDVWCMTVPGEESFSLVNGAVVHNCSHYADALRYFAVGHKNRPEMKPINYSSRGIV